jgi:thioredoxin-related protein
MHEGKPMDVDTRTLIDIYSVTSTPTLIFADKNGKSIFIVPGYMPQKQFLATLEFVKSGLWLGKDRKNGEVYKTLKDFYIKKGIIKEKK